MSQRPREDLQDLLRDLSDARRDSEEQRRLGAALLEGLGVVARPRPAREMADEMLAILRNTLEFEDAFLLSAEDDGQYRVWTSTSSRFDDATWQPGDFLERVLSGAILAVFDVEQIPEWQNQPREVREGVTSALHAAIGGGGYRTILVCTHPTRGYFSESHVRLMDGFVPLASQAMLRAWAYEFGRLPREESATPLLSRSSINLLDEAFESLGVGVATWSHRHGLVEASPFLEEMVAPFGGIPAWWESVKPLFESVVTGMCSHCGEPQHIGSRQVKMEGRDGRPSVELQVTFGGHVHEADAAEPLGEVLLTRRIDRGSGAAEDSEELALLRSADRDPVLRIDANGILRFANAASRPLLDHWGVRPGEQLPVALRESIAIARARGATPTREVEVSGRIVELRIVAPPGLDQSVIYGRDVTDERRTQDALEESEARKRLLIEASLDAVVTMDHAGRVVDWSPRATELFGWSEEEAVGSTMSSLIIPHRLRTAHEEGLGHFLRSGEGPVLGQRIEVPALLRSGEEIPVELFIRVLHADDGEAPLFAGFIRDIREQKRASEALIGANSRLSALIRSTSNGVLVLDEHGAITLVNEPLREMFDVEPSTDELLGSDGLATTRHIAAFASDPHAFKIRMPAEGEGAFEPGVEEFTLTDGRTVEREYSTVVADDQVLGHMWQFRDITARLRAEAAVRRARNAEVRLGGQIQEMFLRGRPPERHPHLDIAVLSVPSQGLDGDFVDFIQHGHEFLDVVVGDVMGKGLAASLLGAATKNSFSRALTSASRSGAVLPPTTEVVSRVHEALARRLISVESFVTLFYSRLDLANRVVELVGCGHPGAILYSSETRSCSILNGQDPPIGFVKENEYSSSRVPFAPGDVLVLYSDGITEAFSPEGEMLGIERLLATVQAAGNRSASDMVKDVLDLVDDFTGRKGAPNDDLTLAVIRVRRSRVRYDGDVHEMLLLRGTTRLFEMRSFLRELIADAYPTIDDDFSVEVIRAAQEAVTNAMRHARPEDPDAPIVVRAEARPEELTVEVRYDGVPFEPGSVALPDLTSFPEGGFGLYVIEHSVDDVSYGIAADGRSLIRMVKRVLGR